MSDETIDLQGQIDALNTALPLQYRSALQYTLTAGALFGFEYQGLAGALADFAAAELADARHLVEKITALGGDPVADMAALRFSEDPRRALEWLVESEGAALQALQDAIEPTGREAASEAIEHRLEHIIMRKQEQVDVLLRAARRT